LDRAERACRAELAELDDLIARGASARDQIAVLAEQGACAAVMEKAAASLAGMSSAKGKAKTGPTTKPAAPGELKLLATFEGHSNVIQAIAFSPDG
ncbi:MAG TPA: hypothetical protein PK264_07480, partial [Hyphomicrobiaceae bacterium]|nr:hypothetical protein [Hyphomicrobiaceae bacterium]